MELKTERLVLRPLCAQDLDTCNEYAMDAQTCRYMLFLPNQTSDETLAFLRSCEESWRGERIDAFEFAVTLDGRHIGAVSVYMEDGYAELGWILNKAYQGKGYAFEAARAMMDFAIEVLDCDRIVAHCDTRNAPSYRLMEKLGMRRVGENEREYPDERGAAREYEYEWRSGFAPNGEDRKPFSLDRMHEIQTELQAKYFDKWGGLSPQQSVRTLLWMMGEAGEVADIIKKKGENAIMNDAQIRRDFVEEMCDVLMYFNDLMLCFGITPEELETVYEAKHARNMKRW